MITLLNDAGAAWAGWFGSLLVQNTIFLVLVFGALYLLRRASAQVRAAVAAIGLVKLALPPFLTLHLPGTAAGSEAPAAVATLLFPFAEATPAPDAFTAWTGGLTLPGALLAAWASLALARLGWVALQTAQLAWSVRGAEPLPRRDVPAHILRCGVTVWRSAGIGLPLTLGPWPRRIYVPADWESWPAAHRDAALRHELAHVTRRDGLIKLLEILVQAVWFFHPLVLLLVRRLRMWREMACDDVAVAPEPAARLDYSRFLADLAARAPVPLPATESASTLFRGEGELLSRVSHQIREGTMNTVSKKRLAIVLTVLVAAIVPLSLVLADTPAPPAPPAAPAEPAPAVAPVPTAEPAPVAEPAPPAPPASEQEVKKGAVPPADAPPPPPKRPHVKVSINGDGLTVDEKEIPQKKFAKVMAHAAQEAGGDPVVMLATDGGVPMGLLHDVQADLLELGLTDVIYVGEEGKKLKMMLPPKKALEKLASLPEGMILPVKVDAAGVLTVRGKKVKEAALTDVIKKELQMNDKLVVTLHTERDTRYGAFLQVLGDLKKGGATRIAIQDPSS